MELLKTGNYEKDYPVGPLLKTHWNQDTWFNRYCPYNIKCSAGENAYAGCIPVAMGQIIRYYRSRNNITINAEHSYDNETLIANSDGYNWSAMIDNPLNYDLEICRMLADLGILINLNYGHQSSTQSSGGRARIGFNDLGYDNAYKIQRHNYAKDDWLDLIISRSKTILPFSFQGMVMPTYVMGTTMRGGYTSTWAGVVLVMDITI